MPDKLILPGVGAFGEAMQKLHDYGLVSVIKEAAAMGKPFLGICLGMQLMFESEESPGVLGLSLLPGKIVRLKADGGLKIPHEDGILWHYKKTAVFLKGLSEETYVYFVHSYYLEAGCAHDVAAVAEYGVHIHAAVEHENLVRLSVPSGKEQQCGTYDTEKL